MNGCLKIIAVILLAPTVLWLGCCGCDHVVKPRFVHPGRPVIVNVRPWYVPTWVHRRMHPEHYHDQHIEHHDHKR